MFKESHAKDSRRKAMGKAPEAIHDSKQDRFCEVFTGVIDIF